MLAHAVLHVARNTSVSILLIPFPVKICVCVGGNIEFVVKCDESLVSAIFVCEHGALELGCHCD